MLGRTIICRNKKLSILAALSTIGLRPSAITCVAKADGGGAQVHAYMSVQAFCKCFDIPYVHTPFGEMDHTSGKRDVEEWEARFALGSGYQRASDHAAPIVALKKFTRSPMLWAKRVTVALPHAHGYIDENVCLYDHIVDRVRTNFLQDERFLRSGFRVAVHIRRGDVGPKDYGRYTPNYRLLNRIVCVLNACEKHGIQPQTEIHSEGQERDFEDFGGYKLCLNENPLKTLHSLATADLLIMAKSSFSYVAGLLNTAIVLYEPFWHKRRKNWLNADDISGVENKILEYSKRDLLPTTT